ncbi:MAG TPA: serine hydrolase, partial [Gemmatimonadales bacterium]|nr:serine hydrolase [Gemmatimonadales bacterium]
MTDDSNARQQVSYCLAVNAKLLCSGVFVSGRDVDQILTGDLPYDAWPERFALADLRVTVDRERNRLTLATPDGLSRTAIYQPGFGSTILPEGETSLRFTPPTPAARPPHDPRPWPEGDAGEPDTSAALAAALDPAFDDNAWPAPLRTRAMVVVHGGRIVAERYAAPFTGETKHISWSMGKSITAALVGVLVGEGAVALDEPPGFPEWQGAGDRRGEITIRQLLQMRSGLDYRRFDLDDPNFYTPE